VELIEGHPTRVICTRKTTPGLRALEKYAVRVGGGANHRFRLDDGVLIKDNHLRLIPDLRQMLAEIADRVGHHVMIQVEVDSLSQLESVLEAGVDAVLLDNMSPANLAEAVGRCRGRLVTEASGGITAENIEAIAASGVDLISVGWLTHSSPALDVSLEVEAWTPSLEGGAEPMSSGIV
jgi:nicotinate-nucleotide pyrophosphorylase (carboxylating)